MGINIFYKWEKMNCSLWEIFFLLKFKNLECLYAGNNQMVWIGSG